MRYFAFLRAINVGGHNTKMEILRGLFETLGYGSVETYIASGNVIFECASGDAASLEKQFREVPMDAKRLTGPLFWLHGDESKERLEQFVQKVAEGGNGTFTVESRPHNDWLGEGWFRDLQICLDAAKKNNLSMWIFDEKWWPSQEVGGMVPPKYGSKLPDSIFSSVSYLLSSKTPSFAEGVFFCCSSPLFFSGLLAGNPIEELEQGLHFLRGGGVGGVDGMLALFGFDRDGIGKPVRDLLIAQQLLG